MFAKRIAFAVVLSLLVLLGGCMTIMREMAKVPLDRPLGEQPMVSREFMAKLASKNLAEMTFYVRKGGYYDGSVASKLREVRKDGVFNFTKDFPLVPDPPANMAELGEVMSHLFAGELRKRGFRVSDGECEECVEVFIDYSYRIDPTFVGAEEVFNTRTRMSYVGVQFAQGWDDTKRTRNLGIGAESKRWALKTKQEKEFIIAPIMAPLADELLYMLKKVLGKDTKTT